MFFPFPGARPACAVGKHHCNFLLFPLSGVPGRLVSRAATSEITCFFLFRGAGTHTCHATCLFPLSGMTPSRHHSHQPPFHDKNAKKPQKPAHDKTRPTANAVGRVSYSISRSTIIYTVQPASANDRNEPLQLPRIL